MDEFYKISGLRCNIEKTSVMFIGPDIAEEQIKIRDLGFAVCDKIKCLGFVIDRCGGDMSDNFDNALISIRRLAADWSRYGLSIQGRVMVSKTFMLSQLTYPGAILTPNDDQVKNIQNEIDNFILKGAPWSKKTMYNAPEAGRLGAINVPVFLNALKCSWIKRIVKEGINDNWRCKLMSSCFFNPMCLRPDQFVEERPLERNIGVAYWNFSKKFWLTDKNSLSAPVVNNILFCRGKADNGGVDGRLMDENFFGHDVYSANKEMLLGLKLSDLITDRIMKSFQELQVFLAQVSSGNFALTPNLYLALQRAIRFALVKYGISTPRTGNGIATGTRHNNIEYILNTKQKGSKQYRVFLELNQQDLNFGCRNLIRNYCVITNCPVPETNVSKKILGFWAENYLPVDLRDFALKLCRNSLPVGARLGARYRENENVEIDERCRNCYTNTGDTVGHRETFIHLFWECAFAERIFAWISAENFPNYSLDDFKKAIFLGTRDDDFCVATRLLTICLLFEIWRNRLRPSSAKAGIATIEFNICHTVDKILLVNKPLKRKLVDSRINFFRKWRTGVEQGRG
jgi:hypothetical protein